MVHVELDSPQRGGDVDLLVGADATAGELAALLSTTAGNPRHAIAIDDVASAEPIHARLRRGSHVAIGAPDQFAAQRPALELICEAGWSTGARVLLARGRWFLSSIAGADWSAAPPAAGGFLACTVAVDGTCSVTAARDRTLWIAGHATFGPEDLGPGDGFQFAGSDWRLARAESSASGGPSGLPDANGCVPFHRPPRTPVGRPAHLLTPPAPPAPYGAHARMAWATLAVPLVMGAAFAWLFGPLMALFALLTPVLVTGNWLEDRVRARRHRRREDARHRDQLQAFAAAVRAASDAEAAARRAAQPPLTELIARTQNEDSRLWERRPAHDDFMRVAIGKTDAMWEPVMTTFPGASTCAVLQDVPTVLDLSSGQIAGVVGERDRRSAIARAIVTRVAATHGPADVVIACLAGPATAAGWGWLKWLPHSALDVHSGRRLLGFAPEDVDAVLAALIDGDQGGAPDVRATPLALLIVDGPTLTTAQAQLLRDLASGSGPPLSAIVLADGVEALPAFCTNMIDVRARAQETPSLTRVAHAVLRHADYGRTGPAASVNVRVTGTSPAAALRCARSLARLADPERREAGAALPERVSLLDVIGLRDPTADEIAARWHRRPAHDDALPVLLGASESGVLAIDLVRDGPHALLAGTTGSGKSELLRTLVSSLAIACDPNAVNFVLVDYKGGSAFDECARLPHVVGVVTDLDEHLAQRALTCLEAELRYRERRLRAAAVPDLAGYRRAGDPTGSLPRLVVVIDEFAALARELPEFMRAIVDIAQRGRSLGVHVVLATQRPAGVVNDQIRANTNLRIALRVQSTPDSTDVLDAPDAARLGRGQPGRGFARLGPGDLVPFQCAYVSGVRARDPGSASHSITITPFVAAWEQPALPPDGRRPKLRDAPAPSDLARVVDAISGAAQRLGVAVQRAPWPPPLPASLNLGELSSLEATSRDARSASSRGSPVIGLADEPDLQRQVAWRWNRDAGNLWCCGAPGAGASALLVTLASAYASAYPVDLLHIYAIDCGARGLAALAALPHTGAVVAGSERERLIRLTALLDEEVEQRRSTATSEPALLLVIDRYDELPAALDSLSDVGVLERIAQIVRSGQELGIHVALSTQRPAGLPASVAAALTQRLVFRLADRQDYAAFGLRPSDVPMLPHLRAVDATTGMVVQFAHANAVSTTAPVPDARRPARWKRRAREEHAGREGRRPRPVGLLPTDVAIATVQTAARIDDDGWWLPIGIGNTRLAPAGFHLRERDHALVIGPARSGKTEVLAVLADAARAADPAIAITVIAPRRSRLTGCRAVSAGLTTAEPAAIAAAMRAVSGRHLILIDDADRVDDVNGELARALGEDHPALHVVAAARSDALRGAYAHWTRRLHASRQGLLLQPDITADGEFFSVVLPRDRSASTVGRGYLLANGNLELIQCARAGGEMR